MYITSLLKIFLGTQKEMERTSRFDQRKEKRKTTKYKYESSCKCKI